MMIWPGTFGVLLNLALHARTDWLLLVLRSTRSCSTDMAMVSCFSMGTIRLTFPSVSVVGVRSMERTPNLLRCLLRETGISWGLLVNLISSWKSSGVAATTSIAERVYAMFRARLAQSEYCLGFSSSRMREMRISPFSPPDQILDFVPMMDKMFFIICR